MDKSSTQRAPSAASVSQPSPSLPAVAVAKLALNIPLTTAIARHAA
ncbi:MAG: hypothetical protein LBH56_05225 [Coriobacteriales bacterium]|jgi:hypothetical protein|nr:hypothetical protein [Coriobacteriales bacterium]